MPGRPRPTVTSRSRPSVPASVRRLLAALLLGVLAGQAVARTVRPSPPAPRPPAGTTATAASRASATAPGPPLPWNVQQAALCAAAIGAAEQSHGLPAGLLGSIAKVESGRPITGMGDVRAWPWTIDADGQGQFLESRPAAVAWAQQALARGVKFMDVGCMQVDLQMHPDAFRSLDDAFDPQRNADYAARYLRSLYTEAGGDWDVAVGLYHSHTPELAQAYRERVAQVGAGIVTGIGGPEPLYLRAIRQGTLRLALAGGGMLVLNVGRQPTARPQKRRSACAMAGLLDPVLATPMRVRGCRS